MTSRHSPSPYRSAGVEFERVRTADVFSRGNPTASY